MFDAAVEAITHTDEAVGTVYAACQEAGYTLLVTADHGNAEQMENLETGAPHTAHTTNKVPFIMAGPKDTKFAFADDKDRKEDEEEGALCDVAPTVLSLLGVDKPEGACFNFHSTFLSLIENGRRNDRPVAACCVSGPTRIDGGEKKKRRARKGVLLEQKIPRSQGCLCKQTRSNYCGSQEKRSSYSEPPLKGRGGYAYNDDGSGIQC